MNLHFALLLNCTFSFVTMCLTTGSPFLPTVLGSFLVFAIMLTPLLRVAVRAAGKVVETKALAALRERAMHTKLVFMML
jgi:hypothetical protein